MIVSRSYVFSDDVCRIFSQFLLPKSFDFSLELAKTILEPWNSINRKMSSVNLINTQRIRHVEPFAFRSELAKSKTYIDDTLEISKLST